MAAKGSGMRNVLITGSSSGIGAACAVELDRLGWRVFAGVRREEDGERLRRRTSDRLTPVLVDVTDAASIAAAAERIGQLVGDAGLDGVVNNAGIGVAGPLEVLPIERIRLQMEVNVLGPIAVTQAMLPMLRKAKGRLVNISSVSGRLSLPCLAPYCASKFALGAISDALRVELSPWGIAVCLIEPCSVVSEIWDKAQADAQRLDESLSPEHRELYGEVVANMRKYTAQSVKEALPVDRVVQPVVHALTARRPKTRYLILPLNWRGFRLFAALPDRLRDWIILRVISSQAGKAKEAK